MTYDDTTTLELSWKQYGQELKLSLTEQDGIFLGDALAKVFGFLETAYGYSVEDRVRQYLDELDALKCDES